MTETAKTTHTPGPWTVANGAQVWKDGASVIGSPRICSLEGAVIGVATNGAAPVAQIGPEEQVANARLIAAAPALLEACEIGKRELEAVSQIDEWAGHVSQWLDELPDGEAKHAARVWIHKIMGAAQSAATQIDFLADAIRKAD